MTATDSRPGAHLPPTYTAGSSGKALRWTLEVARGRCQEIGECWLWLGSVNSSGVPLAAIEGKQAVNVRRYVYAVLLGKPLVGKRNIVSPRCGNARCISPECLFANTRSAMTARTYTAGKRSGALELHRRQLGQINAGQCKLDHARAAEIRGARGTEDREALALRYGVSPKTIDSIWQGRCWRMPVVASVFALGGAQEFPSRNARTEAA